MHSLGCQRWRQTRRRPSTHSTMFTPATSSSCAPLSGARDAQALLQTTMKEWGGDRDLWVFGYASLIWRPDFHAVESRLARIHGWHRCLKLFSRVNRGTPEQPGLVCALMQGGACRGMVYRIPAHEAHAEFPRLWAREMPTGMYDPRWLSCRTSEGLVQALGFTLARRSPGYCGELSDAQVRHILANSHGRYGSTLEYLLRTHEALRERGIKDREIERLVALARQEGLVQ